MSWVSKSTDTMIITCGDGRSYTPLYVRLEKQRDYNLSEFNFPNLPGTFVDRRLQKGRRFSLEIIFQGENNLEQSEAFDNSANDPRSWLIEHPLYGRLTVQPISLTFDDRQYNTTTITGSVVETNEQAGLVAVVSAIDQVDILQQEAFDSGAIAFVQKPATASAMQRNNLAYFNSGRLIAPIEGAEDYTNLFNSANAAVQNVGSNASTAISQAQALLLAPARFEVNVQTRIDSLRNQIDILFGNTPLINSVADKILIENSAGGLIAAMCVAASNPMPGNYTSVASVVSIIDIIVDEYNTYIQELDTLQTENNGDTDSYVPDFEFISALTYLVDFTLSNLFSIALSASQERTIYLSNDTNIIELAHVYYGELENGIDLVMQANDYGLSNILGINAGSAFTYYVE